jgi:hypothetical protein
VTLRNVLLITGVLPLAVLTASSIFTNPAAVPSPSMSENRVELDLKAIESSAEEVKGNAESEEPLVTGIASLDVFGAEPKTVPIDSTDRLANLGKSVQKLTNACAALRAFADICAPKRGTSKTRVRDDLRNNFQQPKRLAGIAGAEELSELIENQLDELNQMLKYREALEKAEKAFANGQWKECKEILATLDAKGVGGVEQSRAKDLGAKAAFLLHWKDLPSADQPIKDRWRKLDDKLSSSPPAADADQAATLKQYRNETSALARRIKVDVLFASPPTGFRDLADECQRILADDPSARDRLREGVYGWIKSRMASKPKMNLPEVMKEAWTKSGGYLQGVFEAVPAVPQQETRFKYWSDVSKYRAGDGYENDLYLSMLRAEPVQPMEIQLTDQFNAELADLLKDVALKRRWESFAKHCEEWQKKITEYYAERQLKGGPLSFVTSRELAGEILSQWKIMDRLFGN